MNTIWVLGAEGLVGEALKKTVNDKSLNDFKFLGRRDLEIGSHADLPFHKGDTVIDLIPIPYPRDSLNLISADFHSKFTDLHTKFVSTALKCNLKKYLFLSSGGAIYGKNHNQIPSLETNKLSPVSHYGEAKKIIEEFLADHTKELETKYSILRCSNIFNTNADSPKQKGLIGVYLKRFAKGESIEVFGLDSISKDYIANTDVAEAILASLESSDNEVFNVGSGRVYSIAEIIKAFEESFKVKATILYKPGISNDVPWFALDVTKAERNLKFKAKIDLLEWIRSLN